MNWQTGDGKWRLFSEGQHIGTLQPLAISGVEATDDVDIVDGALARITRRVRGTGGRAVARLRLTLDFTAAHRATYSLIPAISYDGNTWGSGKEPKGFVRDGVPWSFAWHRGSIPGATYSEGGPWSVGLFAAPPIAPCGLSCSLIPDGEHTTHRLIWPEEEQPLRYCARDEYAPGYAGELNLAAGESFAVSAYVVVAPVTRPRSAWRRLLDVAWEQNYRTPQPRYAPAELWRMGVEYISGPIWAQQGIFSGFSVGLLWNGQEWKQRDRYMYEIGWAGQNASQAVSLLHDYRLHGHEASRDKALACLDAWTTHAPLPCGLIRSVFDALIGDTRRREIQDACNQGNAAEALLEAWTIARELGIDRPQWRDVALRICDFALREQQPSGQFAKAWDNDGRCLDPHGTIGAYLIPGLLWAHKVTGTAPYLAAAERAYIHYAEELRRDGFTTAGALDTHCVDKESAYPLLDAGLMLYDLTGRDEYLRYVEDAAYYTASWQWHYTVPVVPGGSLDVMNYDSFGGTSVSAQHHHLDPYAIRVLNVFDRLTTLTGNPVWRQRALAAWANGTNGLSDGTLVLKGIPIPRGAQCEGYFHTRWLDYGDSSLWLVNWPSTFRLEMMRRRSDWSLLEPGRA